MPKFSKIIPIIEDLVGEKVQCKYDDSINIELFEDEIGLGYSQFNEILLLLGFDRISYGFFQFLVDESLDYRLGSSITSEEHLKEGVDRFMKLALIHYGNLKSAFNKLSKDEKNLRDKVDLTRSVDLQVYKLRNKPIKEIEKIPESKTYFLGYYFSKKLDILPENATTKALKKEIKKYKEIGKRNQLAYLSSDHLDIYVATSMRLEHEFIFVHRLVDDIFSHKNLKDLNLRWFDPTQAYCDDRVDKGLSEALMLKRAKCTLYFAQESDTLGKDSELASTLAQGKPVVAFVPHGDKNYVDTLLSNLQKINKKKKEKEIILEQLQIFNPSLAWENSRIKEILLDPSKVKTDEIRELLYHEVKKHYDSRADSLKELHPLGIQVYLDSGVANGVLVVRNVNDCSTLIRAIITNRMKFKIERKKKNQEEYIFLREIISDCIFRLITGDKMLTNTFWNFYL